MIWWWLPSESHYGSRTNDTRHHGSPGACQHPIAGSMSAHSRREGEHPLAGTRLVVSGSIAEVEVLGLMVKVAEDPWS